MPDQQPSRIGRRPGRLELAAKLVDPNRRQLLALGLHHVLAGIVVNLVVAALVGPLDQRGGPQLDAGPRKIVVVVDVRAGLDLLRAVPAADVIDVGPRQLRRRDERQLAASRRRRVLAGRIGDDQRVVPLGVPEVVIHALLFHQPADEIQVGLAVLHAVGPLAVAAGQLEDDVGGAVIREYLLEDVGHGLVLEDPAVRRPREEPQPGPDDRKVAVVAAHLAAGAETGDVAVEVADAVVPQQHLQGHDLPEDLFRGNVRLVAEQIDLVLARTAQLLARVHAVEQQVLADRRGDLHDSRHERLHAWRAPPGRRRAHPPPSAARPGRCPPATAPPRSPARRRGACACSGRDD